jgi:enamine deaminase RidA (YjgF/YER057c/UK114 family)
MKQVTFLFFILWGTSCSTTKNANQKLVSSQPEHVLIKRISLPNIGLPNGTSQAVWAGNTLHVSGSLDPDIKLHPTTEQQTVGLLNFLNKFLESEGLTLGDVVMMRVYLDADPAKGDKMDFKGMMKGYTQFFGTPEQPNKPARTTLQVELPARDSGALIEIDLVAVKSK